MNTFKVNKNFIEVQSDSGNQYTITIDQCSCRGFSYHKDCKHMKEAKSKGLIDRLKKIEKNDSFETLEKSEYIINMRKDAILYFCTKQEITISQLVLNKIESIIDRKTTPKQLLELLVKEM